MEAYCLCTINIAVIEDQTFSIFEAKSSLLLDEYNCCTFVIREPLIGF